MWIARNKNGNLYIHEHMPIKDEKWEVWDSIGETYKLEIGWSAFDDIKWENEYPTKIILKQKTE